MRKLAGMIQRWRLIICIPDPHPKTLYATSHKR